MTNPTTPRLDLQTVANLLAETDPYLSCDDCFSRIDVYIEATRADPQYRDVAMEVHLAGCSACAEEAASLEELLRGISS
jgi:hypothetical protein